MASVAYTYRPLEANGSEIRLLSMERAVLPNRPLECSLKHASLLQNPQYIALSYWWGPRIFENGESNSAVILLDGINFPITRTLEEALRQIQGVAFKGDDLPVWADAICINQSSLDERSQQVQLMKSIYSSAQSVFIHLNHRNLVPSFGDIATRFPSYAMELVTGITLKKLVLTENNIDWSERDLIEPGQFQRVLREKAGLVLPATTKSTEPDLELGSVALNALLTAPWMSRTWIIQEAAVASHAWFMFGGSYVSWSHMMFAIQCLRWLMTSEEARSIRGTLNLRFILPDSARSMETLGVIAEIQHAEQRMPLWELLSRLRLTKATDPKDKIYGLCGIASDSQSLPLPDYNKPVETVYRDYTMSLISMSGPLALSFLLPEAGLYQQSGAMDLPSWIPEWSNPVILGVDLCRKYWLEDSTLKTGARDHAVANWKFDINTSSGSLSIPGVIRHTITNLTPKIADQRPWHLPIHFEQANQPLMATAAINCEDGSNDNAYETLFERLVNTITCNMYVTSPPSGPPSARFGQAGAAYRELLKEAQLRSQDEDTNGGGTLEIEDKPTYHIFRFLSGRRLCVTSSGLFGLVPECTEVGDQLVVFEHHATYFVIRPRGLEHVLVGPAFVEDVDQIWKHDTRTDPAVDITLV